MNIHSVKKELDIIICDDDISLIEKVKSQLSSISLENDIDFWINSYNNSSVLFDELNNSHLDFDIIFLDIDMPVKTGFDIASVIKSHEYNNYYLIFLTAHSNYVYEAIKYQPFRYIRKSKMKEEIPEAVNSIINLWKRDNENEFIFILTQNHIKKIYQKNIVYFELVDRKIIIHMKNAGIFTIRKTMKELYASCDNNKFAWINSGCIVNLEYVNRLSSNLVILDEREELYISRTRKVDFKKKFLSYWSNNK